MSLGLKLETCEILLSYAIVTAVRHLAFTVVDVARMCYQGEKRPGGETGSPLLGQCVMRRRTGTSAPSALPVQLMAAKNLLSPNRK